MTWAERTFQPIGTVPAPVTPEDIDAVEVRSDGWMLPGDALLEACKLLYQHQPRLVLEAGSGRSTPVLAMALRSLGRGYVVSLDHDPKFYERTQRLMVGLEEWGEVRYGPLLPSGRCARLCSSWYEHSSWGDLVGIEVLIVDGPPGFTSPFARHPAVPLLLPVLSPGCVVVLDDTNRSEEREILDDWQRNTPGLSGWTHVPHRIGQLSYAVIA